MLMLKRIMLLSCLVLLVAVPVQASLVLTNGSFEEPVETATVQVNPGQTVGNWTVPNTTGSSYSWHLVNGGSTVLPGTAYDGNQLWGLQSGVIVHTGIYQFLGTTGTTTDITLSLYIMARPAYVSSTKFQFGLYSDAALTTPLVESSLISLTDTWTQHSISVENVASGVNVYVCLKAPANGVAAKYFGVDAVSLTVVPEPMTISLLGIGGLISIIYRRRQLVG